MIRRLLDLIREMFPLREEIPEVIAVRRQLVNLLILVLAVLGLFPTALAVGVALSRGRVDWAASYAGFYVAFLIIAFFLRRTSLRPKLWLLLGCTVGFGAAALVRLGLSGSGPLLLATAAIIAFVLLGVGGGFAVLGLSALLIAGVGVSMVKGWILVSPGILQTSYRPTAWLSAGLIFTLTTSALILTLQLLFQRLSRAIVLRDQSRAAQRQSETRFQELTEMLPVAVIEIDLDGTLRFANRAAISVLGIDPETPLETINAFDRVTPAQRSGVDDGVETLLAGAPDVSREYRVQRLTGGSFPCATTANLIVQDGKPTGIRVVLEDVSERQALEQELRQAQKMEAIGTLAGGLVHDFNNNLMAIQGQSDLIKASTPGETIAEHLEVLDYSVQNAAELTTQLLEFARGGKHETAVTDLNELVTTTTGMFSRTYRDVSLTVSAHPGRCAALVDRGQLQQVLYNLLLNAQQAMPGGGDLHVAIDALELDSRLVEAHQLAPGRYARITVRDHGEGIDPEVLPRIFEPFFSTKAKGTGLGLASAYGIVRNHGGTLTVESQVRKGTTFAVYLPAEERLAEASAPSDERAPVASSKAGSRRVLVIDDEEVVAHVCGRALGRFGYEALIATDLEAAVEMVQQNAGRVDLVLLDMVMPGVDAEALVEIIRCHAPDTPIMLSSGFIRGDAASRMLSDNRCQAFLQKPYSMVTLVERVGELLAR